MNFIPTNNQKQAIEKMELFCGIKSHREDFKTKEEFSKYFELVQKRGNKKQKVLTNVKEGKTSYEEIKNNKTKKTKEYYSKPEILKNYALKYIGRYFPSIRQLEDQLVNKSGNKDLANTISNSVKHLIQEEKMILSLVSDYKFRNKNIGYISTKLYSKKFDGSLIKEALENLKNGGTLLNEYSLENKIENYKNKGKSRFEIQRMLIEREEDRELVMGAIENVFQEDGEKENIQKIIEKYKRQNVDNKKIISRLLMKGYNYQMIKDEL